MNVNWERKGTNHRRDIKTVNWEHKGTNHRRGYNLCKLGTKIYRSQEGI